ncbi:translation initiation factor [Spatholobus suberectus]|nr:translation initiation factor [Spatholobus suberectus]
MAHQGESMKLWWGELEEDNDEDLDFLVPLWQVIGPDKNDIKKVIEYKFNEDNNKVKITTTHTCKLTNACLSKRLVECPSWPKFEDVVHEDVDSRLTTVSTEEILLERLKPLGVIFFKIISIRWWRLWVVAALATHVSEVTVAETILVVLSGCRNIRGNEELNARVFTDVIRMEVVGTVKSTH